MQLVQLLGGAQWNSAEQVDSGRIDQRVSERSRVEIACYDLPRNGVNQDLSCGPVAGNEARFLNVERERSHSLRRGSAQIADDVC